MSETPPLTQPLLTQHPFEARGRSQEVTEVLSSFQESPGVENRRVELLFLLAMGLAHGLQCIIHTDFPTWALPPSVVMFRLWGTAETLRAVSKSKRHLYDLTILKHRTILENLESQ